MTKVILLTGASAGIGMEAGRQLIEKGHTVYVAARRIEKMKQLVALGGKAIQMDVSNEASMKKGVQQIIEEQGKIDVLINNAGYGSLGALEEVAMDEVRRQFEVNVFGAARLIQLVLPHMRTKKNGRIINISSIGARLYEPMCAWYHSTKYALEGMSDCLRLELKQFGIDVVLVRPGFIRTEWDTVAHESLRKFSYNGPYHNTAVKMTNSQSNFMFKHFSSGAQRAAKRIVRSVEAKRPKSRYVTGKGARTLLLGRSLFSDKIMDRIILGMMNLFGKSNKNQDPKLVKNNFNKDNAA